jgi:hypothetical protein
VFFFSRNGQTNSPAKSETPSPVTNNIPTAVSPPAAKEVAEEPHPSPVNVNESNDNKQSLSIEPKSKYTLGNLINTLIAKNVPAEVEMEPKLVFKSNFNGTGNKKSQTQKISSIPLVYTGKYGALLANCKK